MAAFVSLRKCPGRHNPSLGRPAPPLAASLSRPPADEAGERATHPLPTHRPLTDELVPDGDALLDVGGALDDAVDEGHEGGAVAARLGAAQLLDHDPEPVPLLPQVLQAGKINGDRTPP